MRRATFALLGLLLFVAVDAAAQSTTGTISGTVRDAQQAVLPGVSVTVRNVDTGLSRTIITDASGVYRFSALPLGRYELEADLAGFAKYSRSGLTLALNQEAVIDIVMGLATLEETIQVTADSPILNTTNAEVGVRFDSTKVAELPVGNTRDIFSLALQAAGVSQVNSGQSNFASGTNFSVNGMRTRSNNFMIDGQDSNDPSVTGRQQPLNNTDLIQEVRLITNQFAAEFGRAAGSVMSVVTKSGTNNFRGSAFIFRNEDALNARTNLDKAAGRTKAPFLEENQYGGTLGGPIIRQRTVLLRVVPALDAGPARGGHDAQRRAHRGRPPNPAERRRKPAADPGTAEVPPRGADPTQPQRRLLLRRQHLLRPDRLADRVLDDRVQEPPGIRPRGSPTGRRRPHILSARYLFNDTTQSGAGQVTPPGVTTVAPSRSQSFATWWTGILSNTLVNEFRVAYSRATRRPPPRTLSSQEIPSIEINELGLLGFNAAATRTAIGLALNLPQWRKNGLRQIQNNLSWTAGNHSTKFGVDYRSTDIDSFFNPTLRGRLQYTTLQRYVDDVANVAQINKPLPGGSRGGQLQLGRRLLLRAGRVAHVAGLHPQLRPALRAARQLHRLARRAERSDRRDGRRRRTLPAEARAPARHQQLCSRGSASTGTRRRDTGGIMGTLTGGDKLVVRGGYAMTHDYAFLNIALNIASAFPQVAVLEVPTVQTPPAGPAGPTAFVRSQPDADRRPRPRHADRRGRRLPVAVGAPVQLRGAAAMAANLALRIGYVGTLGRGLFQTLDGNPRQPYSATPRRPDAWRDPPARQRRQSWYNSLQTSLERRFSNGFSAGVALHVEPVPRHGLGDLQRLQRRGRRGAGLLRHRGGQGPLFLRPAAPVHRQRRLGAAVLSRPGGVRREGPRRLAAEHELHPAERIAVHRAERRRPDGSTDRHRRPGGQRHPAQHQHRPRTSRR